MDVRKYDRVKPYVQKCPGCGALLEYTDIDVDEYIYIQCPVCGRKQRASLDKDKDETPLYLGHSAKEWVDQLKRDLKALRVKHDPQIAAIILGNWLNRFADALEERRDLK